MLDANFEKYFWIPKDNPQEVTEYIHQKGIYKDVIGSFNPQNEYLLRPNTVIAMTVAPELFNKAHAINALQAIETYLYVKY